MHQLDDIKDSMGKVIERSEIQKLFHTEIIKTILPKIFEDEWNSEYNSILAMFDVVLLKIGVAFFQRANRIVLAKRNRIGRSLYKKQEWSALIH